MSENERNVTQSHLDYEIDLRELIKVLWLNRLYLTSITSLFAITSIIISLFLTNIYTAQATLAPVSSEDNMVDNLSRYSGLASMAGITLPGLSDGISDKDLAITLIKSKTLLKRLIDKHNILPDLIAAKSWNLTSNSIRYDPSVYDDITNQWVREVKPPYNLIPSTQEAFEFYDDAVSLSENKKTGVITLKVDHLSPEIAFQLSQFIIQEVNEFVADMRIKEAQLSINYLDNQVKITPYPELRALFYELIQQQTKAMMLAKVRPEYVLRILDPPLIPEKKSSPWRFVIVIVSTLLGGIFSCLLILWRNYFQKLENNPVKS